jgi:hypothetical protein
MRLVNVRVWDLTDQELADLASQCAATEPDHAGCLAMSALIVPMANLSLHT